MSQREDVRTLIQEARRLGTSRLLNRMAAIIYSMHGLDAALRCLREGKAKGI